MNTVFLYVSFFFFFDLWDLRSPTKDPTHTSCDRSRALTTWFQQNSLFESFFTSQHILVYYLTFSKVFFVFVLNVDCFFKSLYWICCNIYMDVLSHVWLWDPMDCSPSGSSVCSISQARILEWAAIPCSRGISRSRDRTYVSCVTCISRWVLTTAPSGEPLVIILLLSYVLAERLVGQGLNLHLLHQKAKS